MKASKSFKKENKLNEKKYGHIAVSIDLKERFEKLRCRLIGQKEKDITHEDLLNLLLDKYENDKKTKKKI